MPPDASVITLPRAIATACLSCSDLHVVEQHCVDAKCECLFELMQRVDLDFDLDEMTRARLCALHRCGTMPPASAMWLSLIEYRVVEAETMIAAAAGADWVFFEAAQSRRGLAGADDLRAGSLDRRGRRAEAVAVATPLRWQRKLSAVRSPVKRPRAGPSIVAIDISRRNVLPSGRSAVS